MAVVPPKYEEAKVEIKEIKSPTEIKNLENVNITNDKRPQRVHKKN